MNNRYLLPHKFVYIGLVVTAITLIALFINSKEKIEIHSPVLAIWSTKRTVNVKENESTAKDVDVFFRIRKSEDIFNELTGIGMLIGLGLLVFSREKVEDEFTMRIRQDALLWAVLVSISIFIICWLFIYGGNFLGIILYFYYGFLSLFVLKFRWELFKTSRKAAHAK